MREFQCSWNNITLDEDCVAELTLLLQDNCTLEVIPLDLLVLATPLSLRYQLLDVVKINIGLVTQQSSLLLPLDVRLAFRRLVGFHIPVDFVPQNHSGSNMILDDASRISPIDTWTNIGSGAFGQVYEAKLDGDAVCAPLSIPCVADCPNLTPL